MKELYIFIVVFFRFFFKTKKGVIDFFLNVKSYKLSRNYNYVSNNFRHPRKRRHKRGPDELGWQVWADSNEGVVPAILR